MQLENNTLYYIYDPMCSWCYAFETSLALLQQQCPEALNIQLILGGLAEDTTTPMPIETQIMVQQAWRKIEKTVPNVQFNFDFWAKNKAYRSTYPACRAILAAAHQSSDCAEPMRHAIQTAYYQEAQNPSLADVLVACAKQIGLNEQTFHTDLHSFSTNIKLTEQRQFAQQLNVSSYPSLRLALDGEVYSIPVDYKKVDTTLQVINQRLNAHRQGVTESPCIRQCCLNELDICFGCFRALDEITHWAYYSETEKQAVLQQATERKAKSDTKLF